MSSEEELNKEQKLEAARKKFEELKKKKNSKKSKKSKKKKDESEEPEEDSKSKEDEANDKENNEETQKESKLETKDSEETETSINEEKEGATDIEQEEGKNETPNELNDKNTEAVPAEEVRSAAEIDTDSSKTVEIEAASAEPKGNKKPAVVEEETLESILVSNTAATSDFLSSTLQDQVNTLTRGMEELRVQCDKLKEDKISLQLEKQDLELELETKANELETANETIKKLQQDIKRLKLDSTISSGLVSKTDDVKEQPLELDTPSSFQNLSSFNFSPTNVAIDEYMDIIDIKDRLAQWKGWNIDMRSWRSVGMGAVVDV